MMWIPHENSNQNQNTTSSSWNGLNGLRDILSDQRPPSTPIPESGSGVGLGEHHHLAQYHHVNTNTISTAVNASQQNQSLHSRRLNGLASAARTTASPAATSGTLGSGVASTGGVSSQGDVRMAGSETTVETKNSSGVSRTRASHNGTTTLTGGGRSILLTTQGSDPNCKPTSLQQHASHQSLNHQSSSRGGTSSVNSNGSQEMSHLPPPGLEGENININSSSSDLNVVTVAGASHAGHSRQNGDISSATVTESHTPRSPILMSEYHGKRFSHAEGSEAAPPGLSRAKNRSSDALVPNHSDPGLYRDSFGVSMREVSQSAAAGPIGKYYLLNDYSTFEINITVIIS